MDIDSSAHPSSFGPDPLAPLGPDCPPTDAADPVGDLAACHCRLAAHLHRGGEFAHFWIKHGRESFWLPADVPMQPRASHLVDEDLYFSVHPVSAASPRSRKTASRNAFVCAVNCFYADFDGKLFVAESEWRPHYREPEMDGLDAKEAWRAQKEAQKLAVEAAFAQDIPGFKARALAHIHRLSLRASVLVDTAGGYQGYWLLREPHRVNDANREAVKALVHGWAAYVGGDRGAADLRRNLRVIGSHNQKAIYAASSRLVRPVWFEMERQYDFATLAALVPPDPPRPAAAPRPWQVRERSAQRDQPQAAPAPAHPAPEAHDVPEIEMTPEVHAYNRETDLADLLVAYGYSRHSADRLSRPGSDGKGVLLNDNNTAAVFSSNDELFYERLITPVDVLCRWQFDGDVKATQQHLAEQYRTRRLALAAARQWILATSFASYILRADGVGCASTRAVYRTDATDTKVADAVLEQMVGELSLCLKLSSRGLALRTGVTGKTALAALRRLAGWLFDVAVQEDGVEVTARLAFDAFRFPSCTAERPELGSLGASSTVYSAHRADDSFQRGRSRTMREYAELLADQLQSSRAEVLDQLTLPGLGEASLRVLDALLRLGPRTRAGLCAATGQASSTVARATRQLERLGLVTSNRPHRRAPKLYCAAEDVWERLEQKRTRFRTYQLGQEHEETTLRERQIWLMRQLATASPDEKHRLAARIVWTEDRRRRLLRDLYPDMARNVLATLVHEPQTWRKLMVERDLSGIDRAGPEAGRDGADEDRLHPS